MLFNSNQVKNIFMAAFLLFSIIAITQPTTTYADASQVGVVNYQQLINQHPDMAQANDTYKAAVKQAQDDFNAKSATMKDDEKKAYSQQLEQGLQQKQQELINAIRDKVNAAIKVVAEDKGLTVVVDKSVIAYGGQDITDDVLKKITGK
ncbi:OmpH family outer membrane protein [Pelorhabdus rhamnosifermentans]|uniref:OmpH family outer membrane protein n=1 Tax=Pelorhabdus rhamnosifermentans TaxID=2772457 RepID=UPI001C061CEC|nr:OmpH family outer membrane protein [Pelorhabdus rhamnosifermentans]